MALSETQFRAVQDSIDNAVRSTKRGTPERDAAMARSNALDALHALPQGTKAQRDERHAKIEAFAVAEGLVTL